MLAVLSALPEGQWAAFQVEHQIASALVAEAAAAAAAAVTAVAAVVAVVVAFAGASVALAAAVVAAAAAPVHQEPETVKGDVPDRA